MALVGREGGAKGRPVRREGGEVGRGEGGEVVRRAGEGLTRPRGALWPGGGPSAAMDAAETG